jgi:trigger factor
MSKTEIKEISSTVREVKVTIEPEKVREVYNRISRNLAKSASIPGFRKGIAPLNLVKIHYKDEIKEMVFRELVRDEVAKAIEETGLHIISEEPKIFLEDYNNSKLDGTEEVSIKTVFEVMPEISNPEYKGLEITRRVRPVTDEMVEKYIENRREASAVFIPVEGRKSEIGDTVVVDIKGCFLSDNQDSLDFDNPDIEVEDAEILLGDEGIEKGFSDNLTGVEEDEQREFTIQYSQDYFQKELAGKIVKYKVKVKAVGKVELPELDDSWAQSLDEGYQSLEDFKEKVRENLEQFSKAESDEILQNAAIEELLKKNPIEVPLTLVHHQANFLLRDFLRELEGQGVDPKNIDEKTLRGIYLSLMPKADRQVKAALLLDKIAEIEKIEVSDEDVRNEIELIAKINRLSEDEKQQLLQNERFKKNIEESIKNRKTIQLIIEKAKIIEGEWIDNSTSPEKTSVEEPVENTESLPEETKESA